MGRLRALRAYGGALLALGLVVAALTTGVVVAAGATAAGDGRQATALPLVVLALLAVPPPAAELVRRRRGEVALARLRGARGAAWFTAATAQPVVAVLLGAAAGFAAGSVVLAWRADEWGTDGSLGATGLRWAAAVTAVAVAAAVVAGLLSAREPLAAALRRPRSAPARGAVAAAAIAAGVGAASAAYRGAVDGGADAGALVLAGPGLLGVAAGLVVVAALQALAPAATEPLARRSVPVLVGVRTALATCGALRTGAVVASGVVAAAALSGAAAAHGWAEESSTLRAGAPLRLQLPDDHALEALQLTERLDPEGRWLMAAAAAAEDEDPADRVAWLDLDRYDAVVADHVAGTSGDLGSHVAALQDAEPVRVVARADRLRITARPDDAGGPPPAGAAMITVSYLAHGGVVASAGGRLDLSGGGGSGTWPVSGCERSCVVLGITASAPVLLAELRLGRTDVLAAPWQGPESTTTAAPLPLPADETVVPTAVTAPVPMLVAGHPEWPEEGPRVQAVGGDPRPVTVVGTRDALPVVVGGGLVGDLRVGLAGASASVPALQVLVLARSDTPAGVLAALEDAGARPSAVATEGGDAELAAGTLAETRARTAVGGTAVAVGVLALTAGAARRVRVARAGRAALRLAGVGADALRRAGLVEGFGVAAVVAAATGMAAWLGTLTVVEGAGLVPAGATRLPFASAVEPLLLLAVALATGLVAASAGAVVAVRARRRSAPAVLLEDVEGRPA